MGRHGQHPHQRAPNRYPRAQGIWRGTFARWALARHWQRTSTVTQGWRATGDCGMRHVCGIRTACGDTCIRRTKLCYKLSACACAQCANIASPCFSVLAVKARPDACTWTRSLSQAMADSALPSARQLSPARAEARRAAPLEAHVHRSCWNTMRGLTSRRAPTPVRLCGPRGDRESIGPAR
jgi:hypothetical protein